MASVAFVFPGQGSQSVGMGAALAASSPGASRAFAEADAALGEPLSRIAWEGPAETLDLTVNAQPALLATSIAYLAAIRERRDAAGLAPLEPRFAAGHSMGQYSALVAAGSLPLAEAVRLVRERGERMQASGAGRPGAMAAVIGLDDARIPEVLAAGGATGSSRSPTATRPGRSSSRASARRSRRPSQPPRPPARAAPSSSPCPSRRTRPSWPRRPRGWRRTLARRRVRRPAPAARRERGRALHRHRRRSPGGARRAPDPRRRLGRGRGAHARCGRRHVRRGRPGSCPHRPHQADRAGRDRALDG